jgi:hypothetical protein
MSLSVPENPFISFMASEAVMFNVQLLEARRAKNKDVMFR